MKYGGRSKKINKNTRKDRGKASRHSGGRLNCSLFWCGNHAEQVLGLGRVGLGMARVCSGVGAPSVDLLVWSWKSGSGHGDFPVVLPIVSHRFVCPTSGENLQAPALTF